MMMLCLKTYKWVVVFSGREEEAVAIAGRDGGAIGWVSEQVRVCMLVTLSSVSWEDDCSDSNGG